MNIGIDESGSFVYTDAENSWNCVGAYVYPEAHSRRIRDEVRNLVRSHGKPGRREVKLGDLQEDAYAKLLGRLNQFDGVFFAVATNAAMNSREVMAEHQAKQVEKILEHIDKMVHASGRESVNALAKRVGGLSHQLYIQMICQVQLVQQILLSAVMYFVQRYPRTLGRFRWRIDQKNSTPTDYEIAYSQVLPAFLQSSSLTEPMPMLQGADYSWLDRLYFPKGEEPTYLRDVYGMSMPEGHGRRLNIGQLVREDVGFVDSRSDSGVQIADLLVSGLRRCLRGEFVNSASIAQLLGHLMVQRAGNGVPVMLVGFGGEDRTVSDAVVPILLRMRDSTRRMLAR